MSEHLSQKAFFDWAALSKIPGIDLMHAIPNGFTASRDWVTPKSRCKQLPPIGCLGATE